MIPRDSFAPGIEAEKVFLQVPQTTANVDLHGAFCDAKSDRNILLRKSLNFAHDHDFATSSGQRMDRSRQQP
jgi:hypothetical protein